MIPLHGWLWKATGNRPLPLVGRMEVAFPAWVCLFKKIIYLFKFIFGHTARHAGSQFPDQGSNLCPLQWKRRVLTTGPPGKSPGVCLLSVHWRGPI